MIRSKEQLPVVHVAAQFLGFRIGGLTLREGYGGLGKLWVEQDDGEGADFPVEDIEALLQAYYKEHF